MIVPGSVAAGCGSTRVGVTDCDPLASFGDSVRGCDWHPQPVSWEVSTSANKTHDRRSPQLADWVNVTQKLHLTLTKLYIYTLRDVPPPFELGRAKRPAAAFLDSLRQGNGNLSGVLPERPALVFQKNTLMN